MVAANGAPEKADNGSQPLGARIAGLRWHMAVTGIVLTGFWLAGVLPASVGFALFVAMLILMAIARPVAQRNAIAAVPDRQPWPDEAVMSFAEALPDPCFVADRQGIIRFANGKAATAFALKPGDSLTFRLRIPDLNEAFEEVVRLGDPRRVEFVERVPTERWFAAWISRIDLPGAHPGDFLMMVLDDLTEQRRTDRIRVDFVANASHELRTPLASLAGFIETLQGPAREDREARERFLGIMKEQADRMSRLIDDLLSLSRIEMKAHVQPTGDVDLVNIVGHVVEALDPLARDMGVRIHARVPDSPVMVTGEHDELVQVFSNLVENGCKYGQSGKKVVVSVSVEEGQPVVAVRDFGPGVPEEHLPRLTERFYRVDVETSRRHRGTGLGLAIVKHVLARHRARLGVTSRMGEGATFTVTFPSNASAVDGPTDDVPVSPLA